MTDKEALFTYRIKQAEETLEDAQKMIKLKMTPRSIINRSYYVMFYAAQALFLKAGIKMAGSKHTMVLSTFDIEFIKTGKVDKVYSKMFHDAFEERNEADYQEDANPAFDDARRHVENANKFLTAIRLITKN